MNQRYKLFVRAGSAAIVDSYFTSSQFHADQLILREEMIECSGKARKADIARLQMTCDQLNESNKVTPEAMTKVKETLNQVSLTLDAIFDGQVKAEMVKVD